MTEGNPYRSGPSTQTITSLRFWRRSRSGFARFLFIIIVLLVGAAYFGISGGLLQRARLTCSRSENTCTLASRYPPYGATERRTKPAASIRKVDVFSRSVAIYFKKEEPLIWFVAENASTEEANQKVARIRDFAADPSPQASLDLDVSAHMYSKALARFLVCLALAAGLLFVLWESTVVTIDPSRRQLRLKSVALPFSWGAKSFGLDLVKGAEVESRVRDSSTEYRVVLMLTSGKTVPLHEGQWEPDKAQKDTTVEAIRAALAKTSA